MPSVWVHVDSHEVFKRMPRETSKVQEPYVNADNNGCHGSSYTGLSATGVSNDQENAQLGDANMESRTPTSGLADDTPVCGFLEEAGFIHNGEAVMT